MVAPRFVQPSTAPLQSEGMAKVARQVCLSIASAHLPKEMLSDDKVDELIKKFDATEDGEDSVIDIDEMSAAKRQQFRRTVERPLALA